MLSYDEKEIESTFRQEQIQECFDAYLQIVSETGYTPDWLVLEEIKAHEMERAHPVPHDFSQRQDTAKPQGGKVHLERDNEIGVPCVEVLTQLLINGSIRYEVIGSECGMDAVRIDPIITDKPANPFTLYVPKMAGEEVESILAGYLFEEFSKK